MRHTNRAMVGIAAAAALLALALIASVLSTKELLAPSVEYQKRAFTQSLDIDYPPLPYDGSFSLTPDGYDGNDYKESFNGGDVDGSSWRQYVPLAVWPEIEWFDENGYDLSYMQFRVRC
ncbi:hypothetical protein GUITHDRAFT_100879 [Guillardia theta CCMP2712]|uniref:Uncharacterized protein n=1 Tax=Guillardia theta (strain CCMP2712) TaxID=905079 RepID=L1JY69_GUITC|nr:hypothetical protein GUITHDRAFT_100879 [Guillardia theta CCMP2712]EKX53170.1 hypothetical protein GUITHDRAFT_100879 [Guillardia theta CCMP2712]|eukprot:XP_005840150.1 hypothetical protein GUITHDRAFT_100879 [Guillardia theta CCMP2712]